MYTCTAAAAGDLCRTFVVYRANDQFSTISAISNLFQTDSETLLSININISNSTQILQSKHEVLVPIKCSCFANTFYQSLFTYTSPRNSTVSEIACDVYDGLVKAAALAEENSFVHGAAVRAGSTLRVPIKCACSDETETNDGIKYLVTYPLIEKDSTTKVGKKFNVSVAEIWKCNGMDPFAPTVFPATTVLVPVRDEPFIDSSTVPDSDPPTPPFLPTKPVEKRPKTPQTIKKVYVAGSVVGFCLVLALLISCGLYIKALKKCEDERIKASARRVSSLNSCSTPTPMSSPFSTNSCLSPDLLVGIKYSLCNYTVEELKIATKDFSEEAKISSSVYKGVIKNDEVMIKQMKLEGTKQVIDVHSRINHVNIVKLRGVCYGLDDCSSCSCSCSCSWSYLVFEFPTNGSLRDCLSSSTAALHWHRRTQIAFDIATGLHYLHYSVTPAYAHLSLSSTRIFLTAGWRAKVAVCGVNLTSPGGRVSPEKAEIFEFGVLLLELISGKEGVDGKQVKETTTFLGGTGANEGGCFDQLRKFVDPCLKDDYPLAEALCLSVLAGSCVEDDPMHRPSMEDVLKILARML